jgi:hypothetical protein
MISNNILIIFALFFLFLFYSKYFLKKEKFVSCDSDESTKCKEKGNGCLLKKNNNGDCECSCKD